MITFEQFKSDYTHITLIARGGQKQVYSAKHSSYGNVVIKLYFQQDSRSAREIDIGLHSHIPEIPKIYSASIVLLENTPTLCTVEEKIEGESLRAVLANGVRFSLRELMVFLETGLGFILKLESKNIVHRDIKPENIIICDQGKPFFIDFGIARFLTMPSLTKTQAVLGPHTPGYGAPEQFNNIKREIDSRADIFSLGVVAYECVSGKNPFILDQNNPLNTLSRVTNISPPPLQIPGDPQGKMSLFILTMIRKHPSQRPKNAQQALNWLAEIKKTF